MNHQIQLTELKYAIKIELRYFKEIIEFNASKIKEREDLIKGWLEADKRDNPDLVDRLEEVYFDDLKKLPTFTYNSSLISIYSYLEHTLNEICLQVQKQLRIKISVDDISGKGYIDRSRKYLEKIIHIPFHVVDKQWVEITKYQKIRNLIVHDNGSLRTENKDISKNKNYNLLKQFKKIEIEPNYGYFLIRDYTLLFDFLSSVDVFINHIITEIEDKDFKSLKNHFPTSYDPFDPNDSPF